MITEQELVKEIEKDGGKKYILLAIFLTAIVGFVILLTFMPQLSKQDQTVLYRWPRSPKDLHEIVQVHPSLFRSSRITPKLTKRMSSLPSFTCMSSCSHLPFQDLFSFVFSLDLSSGLYPHSS